MAWGSFQDQNGNWWMANFDMIYALIRASTQAQEIKSRSSVITINNGLFSPTTFQMTTDWSGCAAAVEAKSNYAFAQIANDIMINPGSQLVGLASLRAGYASDTKAVIDLQKQAQDDTFSNINTSVGYGDVGLAIAQSVAAGAGGVFLIAASIVSAGTADAALAPYLIGGGIVINSSATAVNGGTVGDVTMTAVSTLVAGASGLADASGVVLFILSSIGGVNDGMSALVSGDPVGVALAKAIASGSLTYLFGKYGPSTAGMGTPARVVASAVTIQAMGPATNTALANVITAVSQPSVSGTVTNGAAVQGLAQTDSDYVNTFLLSPGISSSGQTTP